MIKKTMKGGRDEMASSISEILDELEFQISTISDEINLEYLKSDISAIINNLRSRIALIEKVNNSSLMDAKAIKDIL